MNKVRVAVLGGSGYTGVELIKILLRHPGAEIVAIASRQSEHIADLHPSLLGRLDIKCEPFDPDALKAKGVQFVAADKAAFFKATQPIRDKYGAKYAPLMKRILDTQ